MYVFSTKVKPLLLKQGTCRCVQFIHKLCPVITSSERLLSREFGRRPKPYPKHKYHTSTRKRRDILAQGIHVHSLSGDRGVRLLKLAYFHCQPGGAGINMLLDDMAQKNCNVLNKCCFYAPLSRVKSFRSCIATTRSADRQDMRATPDEGTVALKEGSEQGPNIASTPSVTIYSASRTKIPSHPPSLPKHSSFIPQHCGDTTPSWSMPPVRPDHTYPESFKFKPEATELWREDIFLVPNRSMPLFCSGIMDPLRHKAAPCSGIIDPFRRNATPSDSTALWQGRKHTFALGKQLGGDIIDIDHACRSRRIIDLASLRVFTGTCYEYLLW